MRGDQGRGYEAAQPLELEGEGWAEIARRSQAVRVPDEEDNLGGFALSEGACVLVLLAIGAALEWWLR
jgi:hypothetical protein